jgi:hypothetical protein
MTCASAWPAAGTGTNRKRCAHAVNPGPHTRCTSIADDALSDRVVRRVARIVDAVLVFVPIVRHLSLRRCGTDAWTFATACTQRTAPAIDRIECVGLFIAPSHLRNLIPTRGGKAPWDVRPRLPGLEQFQAALDDERILAQRWGRAKGAAGSRPPGSTMSRTVSTASRQREHHPRQRVQRRRGAVLNAFRHHGNRNGSASTACCPWRCAQRLSASRQQEPPPT